MEKEKIIQEYHNLIKKELAKIKKNIIVVKSSLRAEDIAERYYKKRGYTVFRSRVKNGYRIIGVEFYWKEYKEFLTRKDKKILKQIKSILSPKEFKHLAYLIKDKHGSPDLMLIKNKKISFVEVKSDNEEIKSSTIEFFVKLKNKYPMSILRIKK